MNGQPNTDLPIGQGSVPASRLQATGRAFRVILLGVVIAAVCYLAYGLGRLWAEWRDVGRSKPERASSAEVVPALNPLIGALPLSGPWSFADLDWNVKTTIVKRDEVSRRLAALAIPAAYPDLAKLPEISPDLLEIATTLHVVPEQRDCSLIYRVDRPDLKAQLVAINVDGRSKAVTVACSYPHDGEHWQLFELTPRESSAKRDVQAAHLLPLPEGAQRRGGRFADDGRLLLELITLDSNADSLVAAWKNAGWEVRPSGLGEPGSFSFLCGRGSEVIYAWSANSGESIQNLMLVRSPTDAELKAQQLIPKD